MEGKAEDEVMEMGQQYMFQNRVRVEGLMVRALVVRLRCL